MRVSSSFVVVCFAAFACSAPSPAAPPEGTATPPAIADLFRAPALNLPLVNRAGDRIVAQVDTDDDHVGAIVFNLKTGKRQGFRVAGDRDVYDLEWLDDRYILMSQSHRRLYADGLFVVDSNDVTDQYPVVRFSGIEIVGVPDAAPMRPHVWIRQDAFDEGKDTGVVIINASSPVKLGRGMSAVEKRLDAVSANGTAASIARRLPKIEPPLMPHSYVPDHRGELAYAVALQDGLVRLFYLKSDAWALSPLDMDKFDLVGAADAPGEIVALAPQEAKKPRELVVVNVVTGDVLRSFYRDEAYDAWPRRLIRDPGTRKIVGVQLYRRTLETVWFDEEYKLVERTMNKLLPGTAVSYLGSDANRTHFVFAVFSDRQPVNYYSFDIAKKEVSLIAESAPWIKAADMFPMQELRYKTRDGFQVEGYVTLPAGASKTNPPPLVVLVHGGPWSRDYWHFNAEVQFLVTRGYAVFQPNYRGSTGYSWRFAATDDWDFLKMHADVTDGVHRLIKAGLVDPKRIAIMGASFGGYLAMCGAAYEPDLYRCAISEAGVFDWSLMVKRAHRDRFDSTRYQLYSRYIGTPEKNADWYAQVSPIGRIDKVKIPVLVAHGRDDGVVDVEQSKRLVAELARHKVPHRTLFKFGEGHGMSRTKSRIELYTAVEQFLAENMK